MHTKNNWNQQIGHRGELLAEGFFKEHGFTILNRNYRTPYGEIDLVIEKNGETVFVEVKTRTGLEFGFGENAVNEAKLERMISSAEFYMAEEQKYTDSWRIDVLAVQINPEGHEPEFEWFENAG